MFHLCAVLKYLALYWVTVFASYLNLKTTKVFEPCSMLTQELSEKTIYASFPSPEASHYPNQVDTVANMIGGRRLLDASRWRTCDITLSRLVTSYCRLEDGDLKRSHSWLCHYWSRGFPRFYSFFGRSAFLACPFFRTDALIRVRWTSRRLLPQGQQGVALPG